MAEIATDKEVRERIEDWNALLNCMGLADIDFLAKRRI
tara:strand:- start:300 stop:413 length:114 start_codon:yes stop_codon:yes gene_type:complete